MKASPAAAAVCGEAWPLQTSEYPTESPEYLEPCTGSEELKLRYPSILDGPGTSACAGTPLHAHADSPTGSAEDSSIAFHIHRCCSLLLLVVIMGSLTR